MDYDKFDLQETSVSELQTALDALTVFEEKPVFVNDANQEDFKAIWNPKEKKATAVVSNQFALIQHKDAFQLVVDSLATAGEQNVKFKLEESNGKAWFYVVFPELQADDGESKIELGFRVKNSVKGDSALTFRTGRKFTDAEGHLEFFARRLICSNGMTIPIRVSAITANMKIVGEQWAEKIKVFTKDLGQGYIVHKGKAEARLLDLKALIDGLKASIPNINAIIREAQSIGLERDTEAAKKFLEEAGFGDRLIKYVLEKYSKEQAFPNYTNWELYNAVTFYASHRQKSQNASENMIRNAQKILVPQVRK